MRYLFVGLLFVAACATENTSQDVSAVQHAPDVRTETVAYKVDGVTLEGFFAYDDNIEGPRPGVIVVHEWWGHNDFARERAEELATLGYSAFALDMYGDGKMTSHPDTAIMFSAEIAQNISVGEKRFKAALDELKSKPQTDPDQIAAIGYCFGGSVALHEARLGTDLKAVVSFHGGLGGLTEVEPGTIKARIQAHSGSDDPFVPTEAVQAFRDEMDAAEANYEMFLYEGALHSFTVPGSDSFSAQFGMPSAYDSTADHDSWAAMQRLFAEVFE